jgi:hypothetical protein
VSDKPTWCVVIGPYRTASTTQYQIVRDLVQETQSGKGVGYYDQRRWKVKNFDDPKHGKVIVVKNFEYLPEKDPKVRAFFDQSRLIACGTIRNPLDIATSMKLHSIRLGNDDWSFEETVTEFFPVWLGNFETWVEKLGSKRIIILRYEWYTTHLLEAVKSLAEFLPLERPVDGDLAATIATRYSKEGIMCRKTKNHEEGKKEDEWLPSIPPIVTGRSNAYQEYLTPDEIELVKDANMNFMRRWDYV